MAARSTGKCVTLLIGIVLLASTVASATQLDQETSKAWDDYIRSVDSQMQLRATGARPFLWIDEAPGRREAVRAGQILAEPTQKDSPEKMKHGLVYDWTGAAFFPNTTIRRIFQLLNQFDRYNQFYDPVVVRAKLLEDSGNSQRFSVVMAQKMAFVTAAIDSDYTSETTCVDKQHCYNTIASTRIQQIEDYRSADEHELPPDQGFLWRLYSVQRYEEKDGGVYAELESIALTRDIPLEMRWLIKPILQHVPHNSMVATLQKTRAAVCATEKDERRDEVALDQSRVADR
jgi:hypothetical protein